jgi:hypothetical protein
MNISEEIQVAVESGASVDAVKAALIEDRTKELIRQRKELLQWAMNRLESLEKIFVEIKSDNKTYDGNGVCVERYSEKQFKLKEETAKSIKVLKDSLERYDWDAIKKLRNNSEYSSLLNYSSKYLSSDYLPLINWSKFDMLSSPCFTIDSLSDKE